MQGRVSASSALSTGAFALTLIALIGLAGCYAKSVPMTPGEATAPSSDSPTSGPMLLAGVRSATPGNNIERIDPERMTHLFAERLYDAGIFSDVVYPLTEQSPAVADVIFEISVTSSYDLHPVSNLAKDIVVGLSILLLQPALPTVYDLEVTLEARSPRSGRAPELESELRGASQSRFEFTWFHASKESIDEWHRETTDHAIDELVARIADHYGVHPSAGIPGS